MPTLEEIRKKYGNYENYAKYLYQNKDNILREKKEFNTGKPYDEQLKQFSEFPVDRADLKLALEETENL